MTRRLAVLAILIGACPINARATDTPEQTLANKKLVHSGSSFHLRAEDDVKKATEKAESKLREYRKEQSRKALIVQLIKQRPAMKQELDQETAQLNSQIQALQQQQNMIRQQPRGIGRMRNMANSQINNEVNQVQQGINGLRQQQAMMKAEFDGLGKQLEQLSPGSTTGKPLDTKKLNAVSDQLKAEYTEAVEAWRKLVDETKKDYEAVTADDEVKSALGFLDQQNTKIKHTVGPTKHFEDNIKALELAEKNIANDTLDPPPPASRHLTKHKTKALKSSTP